MNNDNLFNSQFLPVGRKINQTDIRVTSKQVTTTKDQLKGPVKMWPANRDEEPRYQEFLDNTTIERVKHENSLGVNSYFVVGLTETDGYFGVTIDTKTPKTLKFRTEFTIAQRLPSEQDKMPIEDKAILTSIQGFFGWVGTVRVGKGDPKDPQQGPKIIYNVNTQWECQLVIRPFFEEFVLLGPKRRDFLLWCAVLDLLSKRSHQNARLKTEYITEILHYLYQMNSKGEMRKITYEECVRHVGLEVPVPKHLTYIDEQHSLWTDKIARNVVPNPNYVTGCYQGDGGCCVSLKKGKKSFELRISLISTSIPWLELLQSYFNDTYSNSKAVGSINDVTDKRIVPGKKPSTQIWRFSVWRVRAVLDILPHFAAYPLYGSKGKAFQTLRLVTDAMNKKQHLNGDVFEVLSEATKGMYRDDILRHVYQVDFDHDLDKYE
jgi:hypothetical protein